MGEIKGNDIFDKSAIQAPLVFSKNMDVALNKIDKFIATMKKSEGAIGIAKSTKTVNTENKKLIKTQTELQKIEKQILTSREKLTASRSKEAQQLAKLKVKTSERNKELKLEAELSKKNIGTLQRLTLQNRKLTEERKKLNLETAKGRKRLTQINSSLDKNNKFIKSNNDQLGKQKINIGNYQSALGGLPGPLGNAVRATTALTNASLKFIATPIGLIIAALAVAVGTLTSFFKGSEEGQNEWNKITAAASVIFGNFKDIIIDVGKGIFKLINLDFKGAKEAFGEAADGVKNFVAETKEELKTQNRLSDLRAKNLVLQREANEFEAKSRRKIFELREQSAEQEETNAAQSVILIRQAIALEDEIAAKKEEVAANNLEIKTEELKLSSSTTEALNEESAAVVELENVQGSRAKKAKTLIKELNALEKKAATQSKENVVIAQKELTSIQSVRLDLVKESFKEEVNAKQDQIDRTLSLEEKLTEDLEIQTQKRVEDYKAGQEKLREIDEKSQEERREIIDASIELSKEIFRGFTDLRIQQISDELNAVEFSRNRELELAGDNERAKFAINQRFDEERKKLQKKQVITERANALFSIALNTAVGATNAASKVVTLPLVPFIIAIGALQAAAVIAAPIPQFEEGIEHTPKDYIAGEKRPELRKSRGKWSVVNEPTMFRNSPGDQIISGKETDSILGSMADLTGKNLLTDPSLVLNLLNNNIKKNNDTDLAYIIEKGNERVARAITRKKLVNVQVNTRRARVMEQHGNTYINRIDTDYGS